MFEYRFVYWLNEIDCEVCHVSRGKPLDDREMNETIRRHVSDLVRDEKLDPSGTVTWEVQEIKEFKSGEYKY